MTSTTNQNLANAEIDAIVIGGSAGALDALSTILPTLPKSFAVPIAIVVHMLPRRPSGLVGLLRDICALDVKEAEDKEPIASGMIYLASPNYHLLIERRRCFSLSVDEQLHFSRPAIDVLFESAAEAFGERVLGVLLSGANEDGAHGLARIKSNGGITVAQSPATASAPTMPSAAIDLAVVDHVLSPATMGSFLSGIGKNGRRSTGFA